LVIPTPYLSHTSSEAEAHKREAAARVGRRQETVEELTGGVEAVAEKAETTAAAMVTEKKFRPNLVIDCPAERPHDEDLWESISMEAIEYFEYHHCDDTSTTGDTNTALAVEGIPCEVTFSLTGPCARCSVININPVDGQRDPQTLRALASYRKDERSNILFGQYLSYGPTTQQRLHDLSLEIETRTGTERRSRIVLKEGGVCRIKRKGKESRREEKE
jgi:uncharacterized protein YcbX